MAEELRQALQEVRDTLSAEPVSPRAEEPADVNRHYCRYVAETVAEQLDGDVQVLEDGGRGFAHTWLYSDGRHHDAECVDGVADYRDLPSFQRHPEAVVHVEPGTVDPASLRKRGVAPLYPGALSPDAPGGRVLGEVTQTRSRLDLDSLLAPPRLPATVTEFEAVFWDVGGVILDLETVQASHGRFVGWLVDEYDLDASESEAVDTWRSVVGRHFRERDGTEFRSAQDGYHKAVEAIVGEPVERAAWQSAMRAQIDDVVQQNPGARETIGRVAETSRHQGVVSDADHEELLWLLSHLGVRDHFDAVTTSESVGRTKPDPAMFEAAMERSGVAPERTLMIGDRYGHDMEGAKRHGIKTAAYGADDGPAVDYRLEHLRDVLEILGIED